MFSRWLRAVGELFLPGKSPPQMMAPLIDWINPHLSPVVFRQSSLPTASYKVYQNSGSNQNQRDVKWSGAKIALL
jgi:hypothetical protein